MRSHLLEGKVRHRRSRPFVYELEHDVFYLALDLSELDRIGRMKLLGRNRWRPFTFRDDDHWLKHSFITRGDDGAAPSLEYKPVTMGRYEPVERKY